MDLDWPTGAVAEEERKSEVGNPIALFNGKDLSGWRSDNPSGTRAWKVENGTLVSPGNGPEVINDKKFGDFKLHVEFRCGANANSGVYLRGRYEVQIEDDSIKEPPSHHTGGIYGFIAPSPELPRKLGEWQTYDITLVGRTVTVVQNGTTIIDHKEIQVLPAARSIVTRSCRVPSTCREAKRVTFLSAIS